MVSSDLIIVVAGQLTLEQWQLPIEKEDFLLPLVLNPSQPPGGRDLRRAMLAGEPVTFRFTELSPAEMGGEMPRGTRFAFSTPAAGDLKSCAAGGMALLAYTVFARGGFYEGGSVHYRRREFRQHLDGMLAAAFGKADAYEARYGRSRSERGSTSITARRLQ